MNHRKHALANFANHARCANHVKLTVKLMAVVAKLNVCQVRVNLYVKFMQNRAAKMLAKTLAKTEFAW